MSLHKGVFTTPFPLTWGVPSLCPASGSKYENYYHRRGTHKVHPKCLLKFNFGGLEMAQQLRAYMVLAEGLGSIPSTPMITHTSICSYYIVPGDLI